MDGFEELMRIEREYKEKQYNNLIQQNIDNKIIRDRNREEQEMNKKYGNTGSQGMYLFNLRMSDQKSLYDFAHNGLKTFKDNKDIPSSVYQEELQAMFMEIKELMSEFDRKTEDLKLFHKMSDADKAAIKLQEFRSNAISAIRDSFKVKFNNVKEKVIDLKRQQQDQKAKNKVLDLNEEKVKKESLNKEVLNNSKQPLHGETNLNNDEETQQLKALIKSLENKITEHNIEIAKKDNVTQDLEEKNSKLENKILKLKQKHTEENIDLKDKISKLKTKKRHTEEKINTLDVKNKDLITKIDNLQEKQRENLEELKLELQKNADLHRQVLELRRSEPNTLDISNINHPIRIDEIEENNSDTFVDISNNKLIGDYE